MNYKFVATLFALAITPSLIGCNGRSAKFSSTIASIKNASCEDIRIKDSVKDFKNAGFKYGDLVEFSFSNKEGKTYTYTAPFVTNYCAAGLFNTSICDYEKAGKSITISLGASEAYDEITDETCLNQPITFKLVKPEGWLSIYEKVGLSQKRTYKFIGRDNYVFTNTRDIKTISGNLTNDNIAAKTIYRMSSPFDDIENGKRYTYSDGLLGDILGDLDSKENYTLLVCLNYNDFISTERVNFIERRSEDNCNFNYFVSQIPAVQEKCGALSLNIGDNFFSETNKSRLCKLFYNDDATSGLINILEKTSNNFNIIFSDIEGIERTGFIVFLLEALTEKTTYDTLVSDYMLSYKNYYNVLPYGDTLDQYNLIKSLTIDRFIYGLYTTYHDREEGTQVFKNTDWSDPYVATNYLNDKGLNTPTSSFQTEANGFFEFIFDSLTQESKKDALEKVKLLIKGKF